jgi:uncharacterized protein
MWRELGSALCLVAILEGLVLFAIPRAWQRMAYEALKMDPRTLRIIGASAMAVGLVALHLTR